MPFVSPPDFEELVIASSTVPFLYDYLGWAPAIDDQLHPGLCPGCSGITSNIWSQDFTLGRRPKYDCSRSLEGFYLLSARAKDALESAQSDLEWKVTSESDISVLIPSSVPILQVDDEASGLRNSGTCEACGRHIETLYGLNLSGRVPRPASLAVLGDVVGIQMTSCFLGAGFKRNQSLHIAPETFEQLNDSGLTGFHEQSFGEHDAPKP